MEEFGSLDPKKMALLLPQTLDPSELPSPGTELYQPESICPLFHATLGFQRRKFT
jgi:hypothetical protein